MKNVTRENGNRAESYSLWEFLDMVETDAITSEFGFIDYVVIDDNKRYSVIGMMTNEKLQQLAKMCFDGRKVDIVWVEYSYGEALTF